MLARVRHWRRHRDLDCHSVCPIPQSSHEKHVGLRKSWLTTSLVETMPITEALRSLATQQMGARLVGIAPADRFDGAPVGHRPGDFVPGARSVVVMALPIVSSLMRWDSFMEGSERLPETATYVDSHGNSRSWKPLQVIRKHIERRCAYETLNDELQRISLYVSIFLEEHGYAALYLPTTYGATHSWDDAGPKPPGGMGPFSHRHAAVAAGLGELGINNLLLTPRYGPRVRLVSVITSAPLVVDPVTETGVCLGERCMRCVTDCPAGAFGELRKLKMPGQTSPLAGFDVEACRGYYNRAGGHCGRQCMTRCPLARLAPNRRSQDAVPDEEPLRG
jgi:epoxyqueuosine reductase